MRTSARLTIVEGPDGAGKSTLARALAEETGALYVHHGAYPRVAGAHLGRLYAESLLPAVMGYQDVVMDRAWQSEAPYGLAHRGVDRLAAPRCRPLDRLALRCATAVVLCLPAKEVCLANYRARKAAEYLPDEETLGRVYDLYRQACGGWGLPTMVYDYACGPIDRGILEARRSAPHPLASPGSAGSLRGDVLLVTDDHQPERGDQDTFLTWPFGSFSGAGASVWLADRLEAAGVPESALCWARASDLPALKGLVRGTEVLALGDRAASAAAEALDRHVDGVFEHPARWRSERRGEPYPLIGRLKGGKEA